MRKANHFIHRAPSVTAMRRTVAAYRQHAEKDFGNTLPSVTGDMTATLIEVKDGRAHYAVSIPLSVEQVVNPIEITHLEKLMVEVFEAGSRVLGSLVFTRPDERRYADAVRNLKILHRFYMLLADESLPCGIKPMLSDKEQMTQLLSSLATLSQPYIFGAAEMEAPGNLVVSLVNARYPGRKLETPLEYSRFVNNIWHTLVIPRLSTRLISDMSSVVSSLFTYIDSEPYCTIPQLPRCDISLIRSWFPEGSPVLKNKKFLDGLKNFECLPDQDQPYLFAIQNGLVRSWLDGLLTNGVLPNKDACLTIGGFMMTLHSRRNKEVYHYEKSWRLLVFLFLLSCNIKPPKALYSDTSLIK